VACAHTIAEKCRRKAKALRVINNHAHLSTKVALTGKWIVVAIRDGAVSRGFCTMRHARSKSRPN
jgi:hypothetical protein